MHRNATTTRLKNKSERRPGSCLRKPRAWAGRLCALVLLLAAVASCKEIDCPLDNVVGLTVGLYHAEDNTALTLSDTLTVKAAGTDSVLLNRALGISSFILPVRQGAEADTLLLCFSNYRGQEATDTLFVHHTNEPHFESVDCPPAMFHTIVSVGWTSHPLAELPLTIDSVAVARKNVNYDDVENIKVFLRATAM